MIINGPSTNFKLKRNKKMSLKGGKVMVDGQKIGSSEVFVK